MSELEQFACRIEEQLAIASSQSQWEPGEAAQYMADFAKREQQFREIAGRLSEKVVRPRLEKLVSYFDNAEFSRRSEEHHVACLFGYTPPFPANVSLDIGVEHDEQIEVVSLVYNLSIIPVFMKYEPYDRLPMPLHAIEDHKTAEWLENKLVGFVITYLRLRKAEQYQKHAFVTDPVCGMRINKESADVTANHRGHTYYFCSKSCSEKFAEQPSRFVWIKTM